MTRKVYQQLKERESMQEYLSFKTSKSRAIKILDGEEESKVEEEEKQPEEEEKQDDLK